MSANGDPPGRYVRADELTPYDRVDLDRSPDVWGVIAYIGCHTIREVRRQLGRIVIVCDAGHIFIPIESHAELYVRDPE